MIQVGKMALLGLGLMAGLAGSAAAEPEGIPIDPPRSGTRVMIIGPGSTTLTPAPPPIQPSAPLAPQPATAQPTAAAQSTVPAPAAQPGAPTDQTAAPRPAAQPAAPVPQPQPTTAAGPV